MCAPRPFGFYPRKGFALKVELRTQFSGLRDGKPWPKRGEVVELPDAEAVELLNANHAVPVEPAKPETAAAPTVKK